MLRTLVLIFCLTLSASLASGQDWARAMFETTSHDFGTVARGAKAEFLFVLQNIYKEDVHISGVRSSCGCTTPVIENASLKTWETGGIRAKFNSRSFLGQKSATITVTLDQPFPAEIQLTVSGYIRSDVVLQPGAVDVGEVDAGTPLEQTIDISYAGRNDWQIRGIDVPHDYLRVSLREMRRGQGRVDYQMNVRLTEDAPVGYLQDQFFVVTNDQRMERIPVMISGRVLPSVTVSPSSLALGVLQPGQQVTRKILVRSKRPFQVTDVDCGSDCLKFESPQGAAKLHVIPVTFTAGGEPGTLAMEINIKTDLGQGAVAQCVATASVREPQVTQ